MPARRPRHPRPRRRPGPVRRQPGALVGRQRQPCAGELHHLDLHAQPVGRPSRPAVRPSADAARTGRRSAAAASGPAARRGGEAQGCRSRSAPAARAPRDPRRDAAQRRRLRRPRRAVFRCRRGRRTRRSDATACRGNRAARSSATRSVCAEDLRVVARQHAGRAGQAHQPHGHLGRRIGRLAHVQHIGRRDRPGRAASGTARRRPGPRCGARGSAPGSPRRSGTAAARRLSQRERGVGVFMPARGCRCARATRRPCPDGRAKRPVCG